MFCITKSHLTRELRTDIPRKQSLAAPDLMGHSLFTKIKKNPSGLRIRALPQDI